MMYQIILIIVATALLIVPQWFSTYTKRQHSERLAALRNGAPEKYFEELRSLETYRSRGASWPYRLFGLATIAYAISSLVFRQ